MSQQPTNIIGAGIGGLTLGRCLLKRGIPAVLFDKSSSAPRYPYGITLHASSYRPLLKVLDIDEPTFKKRVAVDASAEGQGAIDSKRLVHAGEVGSGSFRANRGKLEELLREGLEVRWEHALEKVERKSDHVAVHFKNGQSIDKGLVVGADGVHSETRKSLLPKVELKILPFVAFNGKRRVEKRLFDELYAPAMKDSNVIEKRKNGSVMQISVNDNAGELVSISWVYSRASRGSDDVLYKPNRPQAAATDIPEEFFQEIGSLGDLDQPFREVFDQSTLRKERILSWLMRTVDVSLADLQSLAAEEVVLIGDSVHAQPIIGGEGANAAMRDGMELAEHIATSGTGSIAGWYQARHSDWQASVQRSESTIADMHAEPKSVL